MSAALVKTKKSLEEAITAESKAITKYRAYAEKALEEGFPNVAYLFKALIQAEEFHNRNHGNALKLVSEQKFSLPESFEIQVGSTLENVLDSIEAEHWEGKKMYPGFIKNIRSELKEENAKVARLSFSWAEEVELGHEQALKIAQKAVENGQDLDVGTIYVCRVCGNLVFDTLEDFCSVCGHDKRFYMKIEQIGGIN
jgi:rubrerythrin